jgi:protein-disulfide isomerase
MTRSRAAERRQEREAEKRTQTRRNIILAVAGAIALLIVLVLLVRLPAEAPLPEASAARYSDLQQTRTQEGYPRLGDPSAPVTVKLFSSFASAQARAFHDVAIEELVTRVREGSMQFIFVPLTLGETANGRGAARAAMCAAEQERFWLLQDAFFAWQATYGNQAYSNNRIIAGLSNAGVNQGEYDACLGSSRPQDALTAAEDEANALLNFAGIPTVAINGAVPLNEENVAITDSVTLLARIDEAIELARNTAQETPTAEATDDPEPTTEATVIPTEAATAEAEATLAPTERPTVVPTESPTSAPTATPGS